MDSMFNNAPSFNGDISKWDVSTVINMDSMFMGAKSFRRQLIGAAWVHSKATKKVMFEGSSRSISGTVCGASSQQRWLARWRKANTSIVTSLTTPDVASAIAICPNCGTFKRSGRVSCCAPGGAWYHNCGNVSRTNLGHSWLEGVEACKRKWNVDCFR